MKNIQTISACLALSILLIFSAGCSYIPLGEEEKELVPITSIGVLPTGTISSQASKTEAMAALEAGAETIDSFLADYFKNYQNVSLISQNELEGLSSAQSEHSFSLAREAGQQLHYDAILITSVERYQAREGSEYAAIEPASVAFSLRLLAVESGQVIWSADFDQTQQTLFKNILPKTRSTGSGFRWLSAAELASAGLTKKLNNCPYLKRD